MKNRMSDTNARLGSLTSNCRPSRFSATGKVCLLSVVETNLRFYLVRTRFAHQRAHPVATDTQRLPAQRMHHLTVAVGRPAGGERGLHVKLFAMRFGARLCPPVCIVARAAHLQDPAGVELRR